MNKPKQFVKFLQRPRHKIPVDNESLKIAQEIVEKELELDKKATPENIEELTRLYRKAIENYEQCSDSKYIDMQERMHRMLVRPDVLAVLQKKNLANSVGSLKGNASPDTSLDTVLQHEDRDSHEESKEKNDETKKHLLSELTKSLITSKSEKNAKRIILKNDSMSKETFEKMMDSFKSQEDSIDSKLASRKQNRINKSISFLNAGPDQSFMKNCNYFEEISSSTKSSLADETLKENFEKYEKRLEEILDKNIEEKSLKISEIKYTYETQMLEIDQTSEIMALVVQQMKSSMEKEIKYTTDLYDKKRKDAIQKLKEEFAFSR